MKVGEYVAKFEDLFKFSSYLRHSPNENWKADKLESRLKPAIRNIFGALEIRNYVLLLNKCRVVEKNLSNLAIENKAYIRG